MKKEDELAQWLSAPVETEHLEFKEAKQQFETRLSDLRYFIAKSAYLKVRQQDQFGEFGLTSRVWPYSNIGV